MVPAAPRHDSISDVASDGESTPRMRVEAPPVGQALVPTAPRHDSIAVVDVASEGESAPLAIPAAVAGHQKLQTAAAAVLPKPDPAAAGLPTPDLKVRTKGKMKLDTYMAHCRAHAAKAVNTARGKGKGKGKGKRGGKVGKTIHKLRAKAAKLAEKDATPIRTPVHSVKRKETDYRPAECYIMDQCKKYLIGCTSRSCRGPAEVIDIIVTEINASRITSRQGAKDKLRRLMFNPEHVE